MKKSCAKCHKTKDASMFTVDKSRKDGMCPYCRSCQREDYKKNREKHLAQKKKYYELNKTKIKKARKTYYATNKDKISAKQKIYNKKNKDRIAKQRKEYYEENPTLRSEYYAKNRDKSLEYGRIYKATHKKERDQYLAKTRKERGAWQKKYNETHKKEKSEYGKKYRQTKAGRTADQKGNHRRRALIRGAEVEDFSPFDVFERDNYICQICGIKTRPDFKSQFHPKRPQLDHIIPLSKGGAHVRSNVQCLCRQCNIEKCNKEDFGDQMRMFG